MENDNNKHLLSATSAENSCVLFFLGGFRSSKLRVCIRERGREGGMKTKLEQMESQLS